jgi:hypothetical protein
LCYQIYFEILYGGGVIREEREGEKEKRKKTTKKISLPLFLMEKH